MTVPKRPRKSEAEAVPVRKRSWTNSLPVELLQCIFEFAGPRALLSLNLIAKEDFREALNLAWETTCLSTFGAFQFTFQQDECPWWYRSLLIRHQAARDETRRRTRSYLASRNCSPTAQDHADTPALARIPQVSPNRNPEILPERDCLESFTGPESFRKYLDTQLLTRLFAGIHFEKAQELRRCLAPRVWQIYKHDEVRYFNLSFPMNSPTPFYIEITVETNEDNLSLSLVDFTGGGTSSVTFSPDAGAVIKERKVESTPNKRVVGSYNYALHMLDTSTRRGMRFVGKVGMFVRDGKLAFLRNQESKPEWQSTGLCVHLKDEFEKNLLTPCIAFRDKTPYGVIISRISHEPPIPVELNERLLSKTPSVWQSMSWQNRN